MLYEAVKGKFDLWESFLNHLGKGSLELLLQDKDNQECLIY